MEKRLRQYLVYLHSLDTDHLSREECRTLRTEILVQIQFFQHERLIHLLVTAVFAILLMLAVIGSSLVSNPFFLLLAVLLLVLLIPYIRHYYILENGIQKIYTIYDQVTAVPKSIPKESR